MRRFFNDFKVEKNIFIKKIHKSYFFNAKIFNFRHFTINRPVKWTILVHIFQLGNVNSIRCKFIMQHIQSVRIKHGRSGQNPNFLVHIDIIDTISFVNNRIGGVICGVNVVLFGIQDAGFTLQIELWSFSFIKNNTEDNWRKFILGI